MKIANGVESDIFTGSTRDENKPRYELDVHTALLVATLLVCALQLRSAKRGPGGEVQDLTWKRLGHSTNHIPS